MLMQVTPEGFKKVKIDANQGIFNCGQKNLFFVEEGSDAGVKLKDVGRSLDDL
jgi:hypothetical protein